MDAIRFQLGGTGFETRAENWFLAAPKKKTMVLLHSGLAPTSPALLDVKSAVKGGKSLN